MNSLPTQGKKHRTHSTTKIIHVVQHLAPGGLETMVLDLLQFSTAEEIVHVVSLEGTLDDAIEKWPKLAPFKAKLFFFDKKPGTQISVLSTLRELFKVIEPDVVHTHHIGPLIYGGIAARLAGVKTRIHTEHDMWHLSNDRRQKIQSLALRFVDPILVADANKVASTLKEYFPNTKPHVIKNGIDCNRFVPGDKRLTRQQLGLPSNNYLIGTAGRLEKVKGHNILLKAFKQLPVHIHLAIAGDGSQREELEQLASKLGIADRVTFLGHIENMTAFYQSLDVFCLPSLQEGFPLSSLESQACNVPVVLTNVGAAKETLCPLSGFMAKPNRVFDLVKAVEDSLQLGHLASPREFVVTNNDVRKMSKAYRAISLKA
ncbi:glycosyltransferase [Vibrio sp. ZSDZ34]|uniref:Glycosyltransferase n=1 Tax=Vibrio gelatinilyticus TaxID=2893468 RepID=A0A9X1W7V9_9VIBR|nr:glycosyltransferase [Vibrio gelatinilyticus]MCJ2375346.1 glycosyltransferase [Vibrio gelatinilyticus]